MNNSPKPFWPGSAEIEALVTRALAERVDPVRAQLVTVSRALSIIADRMPKPEGSEDLRDRLDGLTARLEELATRDSGIASLERAVEDRLAEAGSKVSEATGAELAATRAELAERLDEVVARLDRDVEAQAAHVDQLRDIVVGALEQADAKGDAARAEDTDRLLERLSALEEPLQRDAEERRTQTDELRQALAVAVSHAVAKVEQARAADTDRVLERVAALESARAADMERILGRVETLAVEAEARQAEAQGFRQTMATAIEQAVTWIESAVTTDTGRILERVAAIEAPLAADAARLSEQLAALVEPLSRDAEARAAQTDDLRHTVATTLEQVVSRLESARAADAERVLEHVTALLDRAETDAQRRDEQAAALLATVDDRLRALHRAGAEAGEAREERLVSRLEGITSEHGRQLVAHLDERTAAITGLDAIPALVAAEVQNATAAALTGQVEPLLARLVDACDNLAHEGGRIEAMARAQAGEARAVEERVAGLFVEVAERAESAVDHSRARIAEGQVALSTRFDAITGELVTSVTAVADRIEARLSETAEGLRAASGHQNGALLDAVNRSTQQLGDGLTEVRSALFATGTEWAARGTEADQRAESLAQGLDALRATVESIRHDPRLEALVVEQAAAREAQLTAIEAVSARIDEVGPVVARALLAEVERAARAASAAEEAVAGLRPEALRSAVGDASDEIRSAALRLDETTGSLTDQLGQGLIALADSQAQIRAKLTELQQPSDEASVARIEALDRSLVETLAGLESGIVATRNELLALTTQALERSTALADEVATTSGTALDDLRSSQTVLREAVQDGAHKAELAALDIRGLRERLTPHLVALADATTRRAEADQAGFDAVLARLDQLLAARPH